MKTKPKLIRVNSLLLADQVAELRKMSMASAESMSILVRRAVALLIKMQKAA